MGMLGSMFVPDHGETRHTREAPEPSKISRWAPSVEESTRSRSFRVELNGSKARVLIDEDTWGKWVPLTTLAEELLAEALDYNLENVTVNLDDCDPFPFPGFYEAVETGSLPMFLDDKRQQRAERLAQAQADREAAVAARRPYYEACKASALRSLKNQNFTAEDITAAENKCATLIAERIEVGMSDVATEMRAVAWRAATVSRRQRSDREEQEREAARKKAQAEREAAASAGGAPLKRSQQLSVLGKVFHALPKGAQRRHAAEFEAAFQLIVSTPTTARTAAEVRNMTTGWK